MSKSTIKALIDEKVYENTSKAVTAASVNNVLKSMVDGAVEEPAQEGSNGQVLATNGQGGRQWITVSSGGGGTSDYTALNNKPQINGTTLSGNKTGKQLGLIDTPAGGSTGQTLTVINASGDLGWQDTLRMIISRANTLVSYLRRTYPGDKIDTEFVQDAITEQIGGSDMRFDLNGDGVVNVQDVILFSEVDYILSNGLIADLEAKVDDTLGDIETLLNSLL